MNSLNKNKILNPNSKITVSSIAWKMDNVCELLDHIYDVNCGGCCYVAYCLAKLLQEDDIEYEVVVISDSCDDLLDCDLISDIPCSCTHYGISTIGGLININDCDLSSNYVQYFYDVNPEELKEHYENSDWNNCYNTNENEFIWETLKRFYYDITKDLRK